MTSKNKGKIKIEPPQQVGEKTYRKKEVPLSCGGTTAIVRVWGLKGEPREDALCDITFQGDLGEFTAYLTEADARALARHILDNTKDRE